MMPWLKLDDRIFLHPKVVAAGKDATLLHLSGLAYASSQLTDGFIPAASVRIIAATVDVSSKGVARLVDAGLWEVVDGGYMIHDFLQYNPSKEETMAKRSELSEKRAEAGRKGANKRWHEDSKPIAKTIANAKQDDNPHPLSPSPRESSLRSDSQPPNPPKAKAAIAAVVPNAPYRLFARFCEETDADESSVPPTEKGKQLSQAKAILTEHSEDEAIDCLHFLESQGWRTGLIDLGTIRSEIGKWKMSGSPPSERARAPTNGGRPLGSRPVTFGEAVTQANAEADAEFAAMLNGSKPHGASAFSSTDEPPRRRLSGQRPG